MWWLGAAALVVGNVIIGRSRKGEGEEEDGKGGGGGGGRRGNDDNGGVEREGGSIRGISDGVELGVKDGGGERFRDDIEGEEEEGEEEEEEEEGEWGRRGVGQAE